MAASLTAKLDEKGIAQIAALVAGIQTRARDSLSTSSAAAQQLSKEDKERPPPSLVQGFGKTLSTASTERALVRGMLLGKRRLTERRIGKQVHYSGVINGSVNLTVVSAGDIQGSLGGTFIAAAPDFGSWSALFDLVRVRGIGIRYSSFNPYAFGAGSSSTGWVAHVPMIWSYDPDQQGGVPTTFGVLAGSRNFTDTKNNVFTNTGRPGVSHHFHMVTGEKALAIPTSALEATLGNWMDFGVVSASAGTIYLNTVQDPNSSNPTPTFGVIVVSVVCDFAYKL